MFLPNKPLTRMTTSERLAAGEADLATVTTAEGMSRLDATGNPPDGDLDSRERRVVAATMSAAGRRTADRSPDGRAAEARTEAVRALEAEFGELHRRFRRTADTATRISPGMLPGAYKVFGAIERLEPVTLSALAESLVADKGLISRTVRELEALDLSPAPPTRPTAGRACSPSPSMGRRNCVRRASPRRTVSTPPSTRGRWTTSDASRVCCTRLDRRSPPHGAVATPNALGGSDLRARSGSDSLGTER